MALLTPGDVSQYLRDHAEFNILLDAVQFTEEDIESAIGFCIDEFNAMTPQTNYNEDSFPNRWLLLIGTVAHLMQSEAFLQLRNQATYNDGDVERIGIDDKFQLYQGLADRMNAKWDARAQKLKQQINMENGYGSLSSGYRHLRTGTRNY